MQTTFPYPEATELLIGCHELPNGWALMRLGDLITVKHGSECVISSTLM